MEVPGNGGTGLKKTGTPDEKKKKKKKWREGERGFLGTRYPLPRPDRDLHFGEDVINTTLFTPHIFTPTSVPCLSDRHSSHADRPDPHRPTPFRTPFHALSCEAAAAANTGPHTPHTGYLGALSRAYSSASSLRDSQRATVREAQKLLSPLACPRLA